MKKEKEPVKWDDLPEWAKLLLCCVLGIIGVVVSILMIIGPIALALTLKAIWPFFALVDPSRRWSGARILLRLIL